MQLPADSFPYTPTKKFRSPKGPKQMLDVGCWKLEQEVDGRISCPRTANRECFGGNQ